MGDSNFVIGHSLLDILRFKRHVEPRPNSLDHDGSTWLHVVLKA